MASENPVTIIGAGILGLACGWELIRRGRRVRILEAAHIGAGSSGGHVGALAPHVPENWNDKKQMQLEALAGASDWWDEIAQTGGVGPGYGRMGRWQPVLPGTQARIAQRIEGAKTYWPSWARMEMTDQPDAQILPESPTGLWLYDSLTGRVSPRAGLAALAAAIRAKGGEIHEGANGTDTDMAPQIWATGASGLAVFGGNGVKGQSALLRFDAPQHPQIFAAGVHIVPHADGTVAIGSTSERTWQQDGPDEQLEDLIQTARQICPALADASVVDRWAGIRPRARSRAPLLGAWPGRPGHFVANGGFKIGFGMAPVMAGMLADLILQGADRIPPAFAPPEV